MNRITRRKALQICSAAVAAAIASFRTSAQSVIDGRFEPLFKLPELSYEFDALEPHIDARTVENHYRSYHAALTERLNEALSKAPDFYFATKKNGPTPQTLREMLSAPGGVPETIRVAMAENAGGHYNHCLFWQMMKRDGGGEPKGELGAEIQKQYHTFAAFKEAFTKVALGLSGQGWAWLTYEAGTLKIESTANEGSPLSEGRGVLLGLDLWEHAYSRQYQNHRADYISAWWKVVNWDFVAERYRGMKV